MSSFNMKSCHFGHRCKHYNQSDRTSRIHCSRYSHPEQFIPVTANKPKSKTECRYGTDCKFYKEDIHSDHCTRFNHNNIGPNEYYAKCLNAIKTNNIEEIQLILNDKNFDINFVPYKKLQGRYSEHVFDKVLTASTEQRALLCYIIKELPYEIFLLALNTTQWKINNYIMFKAIVKNDDRYLTALTKAKCVTCEGIIPDVTDGLSPLVTYAKMSINNNWENSFLKLNEWNMVTSKEMHLYKYNKCCAELEKNNMDYAKLLLADSTYDYNFSPYTFQCESNHDYKPWFNNQCNNMGYFTLITKIFKHANYDTCVLALKHPKCVINDATIYEILDRNDKKILQLIPNNKYVECKKRPMSMWQCSTLPEYISATKFTTSFVHVAMIDFTTKPQWKEENYCKFRNCIKYRKYVLNYILHIFKNQKNKAYGSCRVFCADYLNKYLLGFLIDTSDMFPKL